MKRNHFLKRVLLAYCLFLLAFTSCAPRHTPIATSETPAPTLARPTVTALPPTSTPVPQGRTLLVTSPADSGPGTLRQVMQDAQSGDMITFDSSIFPPNVPVTIFVTSDLPQITQGNLTIDASNAGVILDGSLTEGTGLAIDSEWNTVRGLHITNFTGPAIALYEHASHNMIGGDPHVGSGPLGRGNLMGNSAHGVALFGADNNTITGNIIGTDLFGMPLPNLYSGILLQDSARDNVIGPMNTLAFNGQPAIEIPTVDSMGNTITRNSIHDNWGEIRLTPQRPLTPLAPAILAFDLQGGFVEGVTCPSCVVEVYSGKGSDAEVFEGSVLADSSGWFVLETTAPLTGPALRATATARGGTTSVFSLPTSGTRQVWLLQEENELPRIQIQPMQSRDLEDNRMSIHLEAKRITAEWYDEVLVETTSLGLKRIRLSFNEFELPFDPAPTEFSIHPADDAWVDSMISNGITLTYVMTFWDKQYQSGGGELGCPRFKSDSEIQRYLEYTQFVVRHFKDRIEYFEIWNEPNDTPCPQGIEVTDHIELARRMVPVIRQENPAAKIVVGAVTWLHEPVSQDYLFTLISSNIMPIVDGISWHPFYGASPQYSYGADYYNTYAALLQKITEVASAAGFTGEFKADELTWRTPLTAHPNHPWVYSEITAAKYYARGVVTHLGMDVAAGVGVDTRFMIIYSTVSNLATIMAGNGPSELAVEIESVATNIMSYGFSLPDGNRLFAVWNDGVAVDYDPGKPSTLIFPGTSAQKVIGIDVLNGFEQELIFEMENGNLVIRNFLIKDYPIILRLID